MNDISNKNISLTIVVCQICPDMWFRFLWDRGTKSRFLLIIMYCQTTINMSVLNTHALCYKGIVYWFNIQGGGGGGGGYFLRTRPFLHYVVVVLLFSNSKRCLLDFFRKRTSTKLCSIRERYWMCLLPERLKRQNTTLHYNHLTSPSVIDHWAIGCS